MAPFYTYTYAYTYSHTHTHIYICIYICIYRSAASLVNCVLEAQGSPLCEKVRIYAYVYTVVICSICAQGAQGSRAVSAGECTCVYVHMHI